ncbi:EAL domain-containing protein [Paenisporosarcina cavernae]|uniref:EAL domain-containing protein n=1 Tax=Paenisporosarcina cavernae TaxID=2320858 RepID=A0A385YQZ2_9BACL|nr:EAL domain-containing protein [Paenisporosarcina cavernae]AYC28901.1 EAL domain-containing protein [Paenisporosarcina cavernae]
MNESSQMLQQIIDALEDHTVITDSNGDILYANTSWEKFCLENNGIMERASVGTNYLDVLSKSQMVVEHRAFQSIVDGSIEEFTMEYPCHSEIETRWFRMTARALTINEATTGLIIRHRDISTENMLKMETENFLESITDAFYTLDAEFRFVHLNTVAMKQLNKPLERLIGQNIWKVYPETIGTDIYTNYIESMEDRKPRNFDTFYLPAQKWYSMHLHPSRDGGLTVYFQDITFRKSFETELKQYAYFDELTNLPNRRWMIERIEAAISDGTKCAILYMDIDGFKNINDLYGHVKGDVLLSKVGEKLMRAVEGHGKIGRIGGDEFLVFVKDKSMFELEILARQILSIFSKPIAIDEYFSFSVSVSIGISRFPENSSDLHELMSYADTSMYRAKKLRGNQFRFYESEMTKELSRRIHIENELAKDLKERGVYFHYQPQIDYTTRHLVGFEVLSRWNHPSLGPISPLEFIEIAEESGNILKLTHHLMAEVFSNMTRWKKQFQFTKPVSINVTPYLLSQRTFFDDFFDLLERYEIEPSMIELEITEDTEIVASEETLANMRLCKDKGIRIAIDDFGTGYSMLKSLSYFPVNKIKIDRYFINQIGKDPIIESIIKSIVDFSYNLDCQLVAEGVETYEEAEFLAANGCSVHQGFYLEAPLDALEFEEKYIVKTQVGEV